MRQKILIYDLETTGLDTSTAIPRIMGYKSNMAEDFEWTTNPHEMVNLIEMHDIIVGYNNKEYDDEFLKRYGASFDGKINLDLMEIIHGKNFSNDGGRKLIMQPPESKQKLSDILHRKSLDATSQVLGGPEGLDLDYSLLQYEFSELSLLNQAKVVEYLKRDIEMTEHIYLYCEKFFKDFRDGGIYIDGEWKPFLTDKQVENKEYVKSSVASLSYKIICNLAGIEEKYGKGERISYDGGFVASPDYEYYTGNVYALDFSSLYPHVMIQANLYGRVSQGGWKGEGISYTEGRYDNTRLSPVSYILQQMYKQRKELKKRGDSKEYTLKIVLNTIYGLLGNPSFENVCDFTAAADCTRLGRQWINFARRHFQEHGYTLLYTDTDSVYLVDNFNDKDRLLKVKDDCITQIKNTVPFPQDTFDMSIDDEIDYIAFVKNSSGELLKKSYLFVDKEGNLTVKGMQIVKSTATPLSQRIFEKYIKPEIIAPTRNKTARHKWQKSQIEQWVEYELKQDIKLASIFYKVKPASSYAVSTQVQAQIAKHPLYGEGSHQMLKLKVPHEKGAGVNRNYVGIEYADEVKLGMLDVEKTMKELEPFIEETQKTLFEF